MNTSRSHRRTLAPVLTVLMFLLWSSLAFARGLATAPEDTAPSRDSLSPGAITRASRVAAAETRRLQGWFPGALGLAVAPDGRTAYVAFEVEDTVLVVDLPTMTLVDAIDVSAAGTMLSSTAAGLTPDGATLYVSNWGARNVMVIDVQERVVTAVLPLDPVHGAAITFSPDGGTAYLPSEDGSIVAIDTATNTYRRIWMPGVCFRAVGPSPSRDAHVYAVSRDCSGTGGAEFVELDTESAAILRSAPLTDPLTSDPGARVNRLLVDADEGRAYLGSHKQIGDRGVGNLTVVDLEAFEELVSTPLDNGVADLALNEARGEVYALGMWSGGGAHGALPIHVWDVTTNQVSGAIMVAPASDGRALAIDPTDPRHVFMTDGDHFLLREVDVVTGEELGVVRFVHAELLPYAIVTDGDAGYVVSSGTSRVFALDMSTGAFDGSFVVPGGATGLGVHGGRFYAGGGDTILVLDPADGSVLDTRHLSTTVNPSLLTFYGNRVALIDFEPGGMIGKRVLVLDADSMAVLVSADLPPDPCGDKVIVSPDGGKLYVECGYMSTSGTTTITVYDSTTLDVLNTIDIPAGHPPSRGATSFVEGAFDEQNRVLYLLGHASVYQIDMDSDQLLGILNTVDAYAARDYHGWSPTGLSGVALSLDGVRLAVTSLDSHSLFTYDLVQGGWVSDTVNLQGYFNTDAVTSPDGHFLYTVNQKSDSITQIDLSTGDVAAVIDLGDWLHAIYLPAIVRPDR